MPGLPIPMEQPVEADSESSVGFRSGPAAPKPYIGMTRARYIERLATGEGDWETATDAEREEANELWDRLWR